MKKDKKIYKDGKDFKDRTEYYEYRLSKTQSSSKINRYISEILEYKEIQNLINNIRKKLSITDSGIGDFDAFDICKTDKERDKVIDKDFNNYFDNFYEKIQEELDREIPNPIEKYGIDELTFYSILGAKIAFDYESMFLDEDDYNNLIIVKDIFSETKNADKEEKEDDDDYLKEELLKKYKAFPVAILISPYASKRDVLDYIQEMYSYKISPIQHNYKNKDIKIDKIKKKNQKIKERDEFIYKNKDLPRQKIANMVMKKFHMDMDAGYVGKIISLENKKRKNV